MKKAFIITSSIEVNNEHPLTYSKTRSFFTNDERMRQTIMTVASLDSLCDSETDFYLLDTSNNWVHLAEHLKYQKNLKFISVKDYYPDIFNLVTTHPHKSVCEAMILSTFMRRQKNELRQYDMFFKMTGRYFLDSSFDMSIINTQSIDKIYYKRPLEFQWRDEWNYHAVDLREKQNTNTLRQYCSVFFGWGKNYNNYFLDMFTAIPTILKHSDMSHLDVETLGYYLTRPFAKDIVETNWLVYGWDGASGRFWRY